jgi:hypothetical protein
MQAKWIRYRKWCAALASGGITLGIWQGFSLINWPVFITNLLIQWLSYVVTLLFGGTPTQGIGGTGIPGA